MRKYQQQTLQTLRAFSKSSHEEFHHTVLLGELSSIRSKQQNYSEDSHSRQQNLKFNNNDNKGNLPTRILHEKQRNKPNPNHNHHPSLPWLQPDKKQVSTTSYQQQQGAASGLPCFRSRRKQQFSNGSPLTSCCLPFLETNPGGNTHPCPHQSHTGKVHGIKPNSCYQCTKLLSCDRHAEGIHHYFSVLEWLHLSRTSSLFSLKLKKDASGKSL